MENFDVIVLGAGAAGLTAGIYLSRSRMKTLILDTGVVGGQINLTHKVANYPGTGEISGRDLALNMKDQAREFGCKIISQADIIKMDLNSDIKTFEVDDEGIFSSKAVIIATGGKPRELGLESEKKFKGTGISWCATCDGDFFTGKDIAVIGGGNSALEEAVELTKYANHVTIIHEFDHFQAYPWAVEEARNNNKISFLMEQTVTGFTGDEKLSGVRSTHKITGEETVTPVEGTFIFIGYIPNTEAFHGASFLNDRGEIITDESMSTNVPGLFAAGDVRQKRYRQITTAVSDGTIAALSSINYIHSKH
ncbi:FAD-dependent oxidoreductase [Myxococcota bacterium]|nr:FAD-dependent oxidoreductase [Myxococcota bacterium]MBU1381210.1 FAD-dependent oxidoreductase [Myxococcota bacterium]MBU1495632.1 FAD-dependent oxidoreductase [Myxococcota bacterium]